MKITDEKLSAFLDAELPEKEMEIIRNKITEDESIAIRIANLARVDDMVSRHYRDIDSRPMPEAIAALLSSKQTARKSAEIINFPWWRQVHRGLQQHAIAAACAALFIGFIAGQLPQSGEVSHQSDPWSDVAQVLESGRSGVEQMLESGNRVMPRVTFKSKNGQYCRQFNVMEKLTSSAGIACRNNTDWQLVARVQLDQIETGHSYITATDANILESTLQHMLEGEFFNANKESDLLNQGWSKDNQ